MSKKVLSLALVVVMLMSMFAFSASALELTTGQIGLRVESNAYAGMPEGTEVEFKVYYVLPDDTDLETYRQALGNIAVAYTDGFKPNTTSTTQAKEARVFGAHYAEFLKADANVTITSTVSNAIVGNFNDNDKEKGWDAALFVQQSYISGAAYKAATGFPVDPDCEIFTLTFVTTRELTTEDSIGIPEGPLGSTQFKMNYWASATSTSNAYAKENVIFTENTAYAVEAAKKVYHVKNQLRWADKANNKVDLGIVCGFDTAEIGIAFENGTSTNVKEIGVVATIDGVTKNYTERFVYSAKEGTAYYFRAIIGNLPGNYDKDIQITPYVVMDGVDEPFYGEVITISAASLASNVAKLPA